MQILGIVGSMRKNKHTHTLVHQVISDMQLINPGIAADVIHIADQTIQPCRVVCSNYCTRNPYQCSLSDDVLEILALVIKADALIIGAPLYFRGPPAKFQALAERLVSMFFFNETQGSGNAESLVRQSSRRGLSGKPCALVGTAEYSNPHQILEYLHDFCTVLGMRPVRIERFPYLGVAGQGDVQRDVTFNPFERSKDLAGAILREVQP
jgi:multimeric flavodoxin WrbA